MPLANDANPHIFFVDDDPKVLDVVRLIFQEFGVKVSCFGSLRDCLAQLRSELWSSVNSDPKTPCSKNAELPAQAKCINLPLLVMVMRDYSGLEMSVRLLKSGAPACVQERLDWSIFLSRIDLAVTEAMSMGLFLGRRLTRMEMSILCLILNGKSNKEIAYALHRSVRTIEAHRGHIMRKLCVNNLVDLVKKCTAVGLMQLHQTNSSARSLFNREGSLSLVEFQRKVEQMGYAIKEIIKQYPTPEETA
ncbi:MAG: response regulator transcription factor [Candidatus Hodarchaeota archaeon]